MRRGYIIATILLLTLTLIGLNYLFTPQVSPPPGSKPRFLGYQSNTIRINPRNLDALEASAVASEYNATSGRRGVDADWLDTYSYPTPGCNFQLSYSPSMNETYFHFSYPEKSNATQWLWDTLKDSLSLNETELKTLRDFTTSEMHVDAAGANLGTYIQGVKPDWAIVAKHLGAETGRDTSMVGVLKINYGEEVQMTLMSDSLMISRNEGNGTVCVVIIDGDSDLRLYVDSGEKLENPIKLFTSMFNALGIPETELAKLSLEESWAYPV